VKGALFTENATRPNLDLYKKVQLNAARHNIQQAYPSTLLKRDAGKIQDILTALENVLDSSKFRLCCQQLMILNKSSVELDDNEKALLRNGLRLAPKPN